MVFIFEKVDANGIKYNMQEIRSVLALLLSYSYKGLWLTQSNFSTKTTSETVSVIQIHEKVLRTKLMSKRAEFS